jgi:hypothetical protein
MEAKDLGDEHQADVVIATASVCLAIATIMVSVRLYTRFFLVRQVGPDDYLATITLVRTSRSTATVHFLKSS